MDGWIDHVVFSILLHTTSAFVVIQLTTSEILISFSFLACMHACIIVSFDIILAASHCVVVKCWMQPTASSSSEQQATAHSSIVVSSLEAQRKSLFCVSLNL